jgi:phage replication O-like protein O
MAKTISAPFRHVQTPTEIFDYWIPILGHVELKVLMIIVRQTFGWHKTKDRISISQLVEKTGSCRSNVCNAINVLIDHGLVKKELIGDIGNQQTIYELIIEEIPTSINSPPPQYQIDTPPSIDSIPTKETLTKETKTKEKKEDARARELPFSLSSFSENQFKEISKTLQAQGYSEEQILNSLSFAKKNDFWRSTIQSVEGLIKNFKTIVSQSPKLKKDMTELELFQDMVKQIHKIEPLSVGHLKVDNDRKEVYESHYMRAYPFDRGVNIVYRQILESYGKY